MKKLFGDPFQDSPVGKIPASKVVKYCHYWDAICHGISIIWPDHLNYEQDVQAAAKFVIDHAKL